ncbi:MAG: HAMP domain-containing sensor histidine kinase [Nitriliruptoraceae bacterium]
MAVPTSDLSIVLYVGARSPFSEEWTSTILGRVATTKRKRPVRSRVGSSSSSCDLFSSGRWQQRGRFLLTSGAVLLIVGTLLSTSWWPDDHVDMVATAFVVAAAALAATLTSLERLERFWDRWGAVLGAGVLAVLIATTGGAESMYADFFLLIPVAAGLLLGRRDFVVAGVATTLGVFTPVVYDHVDAHFVSDTLGDLGIWLSVGVAVHLLATELQRRVSDLEQANGIREAFLSGISHELRTPLTILKGAAETLSRRDGELRENQREKLVAQLVRNSHRLSGLVTDLLDVDRLVRGGTVLDTHERDLAELAGTILDQMEIGNWPVDVHLESVIAFVDVPKFSRVVENLVANSIRHTPAGTSITVRTGYEAPFAVLTVEDDGPGIPECDKTRIFEPFVQGDVAASSASPGTGIGLTLVAQLTEAHGGRVELDDAPGGGARFRVLLPGRPGPLEAPDRSSSSVRRRHVPNNDQV